MRNSVQSDGLRSRRVVLEGCSDVEPVARDRLQGIFAGARQTHSVVALFQGKRIDLDTPVVDFLLAKNKRKLQNF